MNYTPRHMKRKPPMKPLQTTIRFLFWGSIVIGAFLLVNALSGLFV
jgi:hypothetical protein